MYRSLENTFVALYENGGETAICYNLLLANLVKAYYAHNKIAPLPFGKLERIFMDSSFQKRYHVKKLPDNKFIGLFMQCLKGQNLSALTKLYSFVIEDCGGFDINNFVLRSDVDIK